MASSCDHREGFLVARPADRVRFHPGVVAFFEARGLGVLGTPFWELDAALAPAVAVHGTDPWRGTLRFARRGDELAVELDAAARVVAVERP